MALVAADALLGTAVVWLFMDRVIAKSAPSPAAAAHVRDALGGMVLWVLIAVPLGWAVGAAVLHFFVWMADGDRGYAHTLAVVGESRVVSLALFPATALGFYLLLQRVPADPEAAAAFFRRAANGGSLLLVLTISSAASGGQSWRRWGLARSTACPLGRWRS